MKTDKAPPAGKTAGEDDRHDEAGCGRRSFLKTLTAGAAGAAAVGSGCAPDWDKFFQKHYKEMTAKDKERVFKRIAAEAKRDNS